MPKPKSIELPSGLIIPDTHGPYHDTKAFTLMMMVALDLRPKYLRILGDFADCYSVSFHSKDPKRTAFFDVEVEEVKRLLTMLDGLGATDKEYCAGNHEDRLSRYLTENAPQVLGMLTIDEILELKKRGWKYVPYKESSKLFNLNITHDVGTSTRYSVFKCLDTFTQSNVTGHTHRMGYIVEGDSSGETKVSAQFGWLGDIDKVDYMHKVRAKKDWHLGFGVMYVNEETGIVYVVPVPIIKRRGEYSCVVNGRLYRS